MCVVKLALLDVRVLATAARRAQKKMKHAITSYLIKNGFSKYLFSVLPVLILTVISGGHCTNHSLSVSIRWFLSNNRFCNSILLPGKVVFIVSAHKHTQPGTHTRIKLG